MKKSLLCIATITFVLLIRIGPLCAEAPVLNLTKYKDEASVKAHEDELVTVKLRGKINHSGPPETQSYHAVVPGVQVWLAEYPASKELKVLSDEEGWWTMNVLKPKGTDIKVSFVYTKPDWITTKSNVLTVGDVDDTDIAIQFIDPKFFRSFIKPGIQLIMKGLQPDSDPTLKNAVVVTVGKSWANIHDDRLPHGDPGATVNEIPGAYRALYFDKTVKPNPALTCTSVDGGVAWLNVPMGTHVLKASKEGVEYQDAEFVVSEADLEDDVLLYIASPPDSIQGTNDSPPGEN